MQTSSFVLLFIQCVYALVNTEDHERARRDLSMLRMGKRALGMLRMGRSMSLPPLVPPQFELPEDDMSERDITYDILKYEDERAPPLPRLGNLFYQMRRELGEDDDTRQLWTIPRVGRYLKLAMEGRHKRSTDEQVAEHDVEKRDVDSEDERSVTMPRLGLYDRAVPKPRLGLYERTLPFPRLGVREESEEDNTIDEVAIPASRLGDFDKRAMGMLRMGRSQGATTEEDKRAMGMLRMGRGLSMLRMGKRAMGMLRMGRSDGTQEEEEKRAMGMLRMGKRAMGMLRMGRSDGSEFADEAKRSMGMLRMGKRAMGMLRMGRSSADEAEEKRAMGMLRMGRGLSMLRMGRSSPSDETTEEKRAMGMLRMGKRS